MGDCSAVSAVAGDVPVPGGSGGALVASVWPQASETELDAWAADHASVGRDFERRAEDLNEEMLKQASLLVGAAGDANQRTASALRDYLYTGANALKAASAEASALRAVVLGLKIDLTNLADEGTTALDSAPNAATHAALTARYAAEATAIAAAAAAELEAVPVTPPPPPPPWESKDLADRAKDTETADAESRRDTTVQAVDHRGEREGGDNAVAADGEKPTRIADAGAEGAVEGDTATPDAGSDPVRIAEDTGLGDEVLTPTKVADALNEPTDGSGTTQFMPLSPASMFQGGAPSMPGNPASLGGAAGSVKPPQIPSSALNPSSAFNPAQSLGGASSSLNAPTSPAASNPLQAFTAPLSDTAGSFQSGLSSGLGSSAVSGVGPRAVDPAMLSSPPPGVTGQPVAAAQAAGVVGPGAPAAPPPPPAGPVGGGMPMGGGGMIPPASGAAAPLGPYTPPGGAAPPAGTPAATAAASAPSAGPAASTPGSAQGGTTAAPLVGSTTGAAAAMTDQEMNPDLATATRVLEGLVRGTTAAKDPVYTEWAVAVTRTAMGPITVIASSVGGGAYLPSSVYVPMGVRVAPLDSSLPMGWASQFMGWQHPVDVVIAHAQTMAQTVAGVRVSAIATTDGFGPRPKDGADFVAVTVREILGRPGSAPMFDGAHQHRLTTVDPSLAQRVAALDRGGDMTTAVAADLSVAVIRAAQEHTRPDGVGVVHDDDVKALLAIKDRKPVDWDQHFQDVSARDNHAIVMPEAAATPVDLDDAEVSVALRARYTGFYIAGRIVELVRCWRQSPPSILDIAYCGLMAGAGGAVAAVIGAWEREGAA